MGSKIEIQVLDFFSGCGGMSSGFYEAKHPVVKFKLLGAVDTDRHANETYRRMLGVIPEELDIREVCLPQQMNRLKVKWEVSAELPLVVIGCTPCQGFSSHRKKDRRQDVRNSLLSSFAQVVKQLQPDVVVMENVPEMFQLKHWTYYEDWLRTVEGEGYRVRAQIHNLAQFGVPQERYRALVIAWKSNVQFQMPVPFVQSSQFRTVRSAIGHLAPLEAGQQDADDPMHVTSRHRSQTVELLRMIPADGGSRRSLPPELNRDCWVGVDGFRDVYGRLSWDKPAVAITARCRTPSCGRFAHPEQHRGLSVREAALLQGFPETYDFVGPFDDKFKQIGNAVSPIFARAIAEQIASEWVRIASGVGPHAETKPIDITEPLQKSFSSSIAGLKRQMRLDATNQSSSSISR